MNAVDLMKLMSQEIGLTVKEIAKIAVSAPFRYKSYRIPKRTGGFRQIRHPTPEVKAIQTWLVMRVLSKLPVHSSVYSYQKNIGIRDHAQEHLRSRYFLRFDFADFFPSIKFMDVVSLLDREVKLGKVVLDTDAMSMIARLVCCADNKKAPIDPAHLALGIGSPSSPAISNAILFELDGELEELSRSYSAIYTRYADDIYFSTNRPHMIDKIRQAVPAIIEKQPFPKLLLNQKKTSSVSRRHRIQVTGVVITPDRQLSVGRDRKRAVKAQIHKYSLDQLSSDQLSSLRGMLAFIKSIEPEFIERLSRKYGEEVINEIL
jgi:RNA-directed DNA polymerase